MGYYNLRPRRKPQTSTKMLKERESPGCPLEADDDDITQSCIIVSLEMPPGDDDTILSPPPLHNDLRSRVCEEAQIAQDLESGLEKYKAMNSETLYLTLETACGRMLAWAREYDELAQQYGIA